MISKIAEINMKLRPCFEDWQVLFAIVENVLGMGNYRNWGGFEIFYIRDFSRDVFILFET